MNSSPRHLRPDQQTQAVLYCIVVISLLAFGRAHAQPKIWEMRPYTTKVLVIADDSPRWSARIQRQIREQLADQVLSWVGDAWTIQIEAAARPLEKSVVQALAAGDGSAVDISDIAKEMAAEIKSFDKVFLLAFTDREGKPRVSSWEWDTQTMTWSHATEKEVVTPQRLLTTAGEVIVQSFRPLARIESIEDGKVRIRGRASEISFRQPRLQPLGVNSVLQICQTNAGLLNDGPLPGGYLIVDGKTEAYITCSHHGRYSLEQLARTVADGRWIALEMQPRHHRSLLQLQRTQDSGTYGPHYAMQIRQHPGNRVVWRGTVDAQGRVFVPNSVILKTGKSMLHTLEVLVHGFAVDARLLPLGWKRQVEVEMTLNQRDLAALAKLAVCRDLVTEFSTRREIAAQRIKSRLAAKRKDAARELLTATRQAEKQPIERLKQRFAAIQATFAPDQKPSAAVQQHWKSLTSRWSQITAAKELDALSKAAN